MTTSIETTIRKIHLGEIPIDTIVESSHNPRRDFVDVDELAASIKCQGVLNPVMVKASAAGGANWELVCGARRIRAAKQAGLATVPAIELEDCTDDQALEIQLVENCQRADVHPMQEAEAIEVLLKKLGEFSASTIDAFGEVARRLGKSAAHIRRRMVLLGLPKDARKAYLEGKISQEVAVVIARIPDEAGRAKASKAVLAQAHHEILSAARAAEIVEDEILTRLKEAAFKPDDITLLPKVGGCTGCPNRSGNNQDLFGDVDGDDLCMDPACFRAKTDAEWNRRTKEAAASNQRVLSKDEVKKAFPNSWDRDRISSEYVSPSDTYYDGNKSRTYSAVLGKFAPPKVLVRSPGGVIMEVFEKKAVVAALRKAAPKKKASASSSSKGSNEAERKKEQERRVQQKEIRIRTAKMIIAKAEGGIADETFLRIVAESYIEDSASDILERRGVKSAKQLLNPKTPLTIAQLRGIVIELALCDFDSEYGHYAEKRIESISKTLSIDTKSLAAGVAKEFAEKARKPVENKKVGARG